MEFFKGWRALNECLDMSDLTAPTQLTAYKLFAIFDEHRFPESLLVSDRELMSRTNIKSTKTIWDARRQLKNAGIIDFTAAQGKTTRYRLTLDTGEDESKQFANSLQTVSKQLVNSSQTVETSFNIHAHAPLTPDPDPSAEEADAPAHARVNCNSIHELWKYETGFQLRGSVGLELEELDRKHGRAAVHKAIIETVKANPRNYFNYFKAVLKGGEKNVVKPQQSGNGTAGIYRTVDNRPKTSAGDSYETASGKGSFDDEPEPDYSWIYDAAENSA